MKKANWYLLLRYKKMAKIRYGAKFVSEDLALLRKLAKKTKRSLASFIDEAVKMVIKKYDK